jgi:hypothetical protein
LSGKNKEKITGRGKLTSTTKNNNKTIGKKQLLKPLA